MRKLLLATAVASSPAMADIPEDCTPLNTLVEGFQQRFDEGLLPMNISPQIERFYELAQDEADGLEPNAQESFRTGQELGLKFRAMGLQPFQMQYVLESLQKAVTDCINRPEA